jgi:uncharacterized protein
MKIAVVGSGIAGLSASRTLSQAGHAVTLFEAGSTLGGHARTVDVALDGKRYPVDTGFLVFNERTYPGLIGLFKELEVEVAPSEMSFSVSLGGELEWAGTNLGTVFAQKSNLLRPRFMAMLRDILRFNRDATAAATAEVGAQLSLNEYLKRNRYSDAFRDWYLLPMAGAIWSCPTATMLDYPFATFARFCHNHGLLQVSNRPRWFTVRGGSREYVQRVAATLKDIRLNSPVQQLRRTANGVLVRSAQQEERFDQVVLACHSDQALAMLDSPSEAEARILGAIRYQANTAYLHTDRALLPRRRSTWAAWNYLSTGPGTLGERPVAVTYLLNKLQPLPFKTPLMMTLNPFAPPAAEQVIEQVEFAHPVFDEAAVAAQSELTAIQGTDRVWYAGAWCGYGFHEDGFQAGQSAAQRLITANALRAAA